MNPEELEVADSLQHLSTRIQDAYQRKFKRPAEYVVAAPGRVNLIGEHIDYNDGFVMPMAIDRYVVMAAGFNGAAGSQAHFHSVNLNERAALDTAGSSQPQSDGWARYIEGVMAGFIKRGHDIPALNVLLESTVPLGGGLSSSAALEVAAATLLESVCQVDLDPIEKALLCQQAEHVFAGVPCGIMDQFSSVFGKANELMLLDCLSKEIRPVPFAQQEITVLITNSNVKHELSGGEYAVRRSQCDSALKKMGRSSWRDVTLEQLQAHQGDLSDQEYRRGRHVIGEIARTLQAAEAFGQQDWSEVGRLMYASHDSLRDDYEVSCEELDLLVDLARNLGPSAGVIGSRMTGGGFGGCTVTLVHSQAASSVMETIGEEYASKTGRQASSFASRPARGAHVIRGNA